MVRPHSTAVFAFDCVDNVRLCFVVARKVVAGSTARLSEEDRLYLADFIQDGPVTAPDARLTPSGKEVAAFASRLRSRGDVQEAPVNHSPYHSTLAGVGVTWLPLYESGTFAHHRASFSIVKSELGVLSVM